MSFIQQSKDLHKIDRRLEFHLAKNPKNGFNNSSFDVKNATENKSNDDTMKKKSSDGLFNPEIVMNVSNWQKIRRIGPGFFNQGNTCYLNSTLQCLLYIPALTQVLLNEDIKLFKTLPNNNQFILPQFQRLVIDAFKASPDRAISPRNMVQNIRYIGKQFRPMRQEDAHEYLRKLLDCMHEEILKNYGIKLHDGKITETTVIFRIFGGNLRNELLCNKCHFSSKTYNPFLDLSLEITKGVSSVNMGIKTFSQKERLTAGNEWFCEKCKMKVQATKQLTISKAPQVLVLHLKRFSHQGMHSIKINKRVEFTLDLTIDVSGTSSSSSSSSNNNSSSSVSGNSNKSANISGTSSNNINNNNVNNNNNNSSSFNSNGKSVSSGSSAAAGGLREVGYKLVGLIRHYGSSSHSGHYVAFVQAANGQWYEMNDSQVTAVSVKRVLEQEAYILFYNKVNTSDSTGNNSSNSNGSNNMNSSSVGNDGMNTTTDLKPSSSPSSSLLQPIKIQNRSLDNVNRNKNGIHETKNDDDDDDDGDDDGEKLSKTELKVLHHQQQQQQQLKELNEQKSSSSSQPSMQVENRSNNNNNTNPSSSSSSSLLESSSSNNSNCADNNVQKYDYTGTLRIRRLSSTSLRPLRWNGHAFRILSWTNRKALPLYKSHDDDAAKLHKTNNTHADDDEEEEDATSITPTTTLSPAVAMEKVYTTIKRGGHEITLISHKPVTSNDDDDDDDDDDTNSTANNIRNENDRNTTTNTTTTNLKNNRMVNDKTKSSSIPASKPITAASTASTNTIFRTILDQSRRGRELGGEGLWGDDDDDDDDSIPVNKDNTTSTNTITTHTATPQSSSSSSSSSSRTSKAETVKKLVTQQRRAEQKQLASKRPNEWNQLLDRGKVKKVKTSVSVFDNNNNGKNGSDEIDGGQQSNMSNMNQFQNLQNQFIDGRKDKVQHSLDSGQFKHKRNFSKPENWSGRAKFH